MNWYFNVLLQKKKQIFRQLNRPGGKQKQTAVIVQTALISFKIFKNGFERFLEEILAIFLRLCAANTASIYI